MVRHSSSLSSADVSVIVQMSRLCSEQGALDLARGSPLEPAPTGLKQAAVEALIEDRNEYSMSEGVPLLRHALAANYRMVYGCEVDPDKEVTICCGSTEALMCTLLTLVERDDDVVVFEPFYESSLPLVALAQGTVSLVRLHRPNWAFLSDELRAALSPRTRAIILNTPHNPTGKVYSPEELAMVSDICRSYDIIAIVDHVYSQFVYDGDPLVNLRGLPGMAPRTIEIGSASKTYGVTGWRLGYIFADATWTQKIRELHSYTTVCAPTPLQQALAAYIGDGRALETDRTRGGQERRDMLVAFLREAGFEAAPPEGGWYLMADYSSLSSLPDTRFALWLLTSCKVGAVPGSYFCRDGAEGHMLRFCFYRPRKMLEEAGLRLSAIRSRLPTPELL